MTNDELASTSTPARRAKPKQVLLWLAIFAYLPLLLAHGVEAWSEPAVDFPPLYSATKAVFDQHHSPYGDDAFEQQARALGRWVPPFIYPPPSLLVLFPLHFFSYDTAKALMLIVNHLCLLGATVFLFRRLFREEFDRSANQLTAAVVIAYVLLFDPTVVTLHLGQVNLLLLVCLLLTWDALRRNGSAPAIAIPLTLAIAIKTYPVLLIGVLIVRRRYSAVAWTVALFGALCAASYCFLPSGIWHEWVTKALPNGAEPHAGPWNQNIRAFVARTFSPNPFCDAILPAHAIVKPLIQLLPAAVALSSAWASLRCWRLPHSARAVDILMSLSLFAIFLIAPVSWEHHFVYLLPALVLVLLLLLEGEVRGHWQWLLALSLCLVAWRLPIASPALTSGFWTLLISLKFYPAVALWLFFLHRTFGFARSATA